MAEETVGTHATKEIVRRRQPVGPAVERSGGQAEVVDGAQLARSLDAPGEAVPSDILRLQRAAGNWAVGQLIQTKLTVGAAGDSYEQEADRVAEQVLTAPGPAATASGSERTAQRQTDEEEIQTKPVIASISRLVQRGPMDEEEIQTRRVQRGPMDEEEIQTKRVQRGPMEEEEIQTKAVDPLGSFDTNAAWEQRLESSRGGGMPLPGEVRDFMEPRFGADFSGVRVHTGGEAGQLNREISAQAFTHGQDIYLDDGKYSPGTTGGKRLLAHELTHVVQQTGSAHRMPAAWVQRWAEHEHLAFGDTAASLAATVTDWTIDGRTGNAINARTTQVDENEDEYGTKIKTPADKLKEDLGGQLAKGGTPVDTTKGIGVEYGGLLGRDKQKMSFGHATMLGGDYFKTAEGGVTETRGLAQAGTINPMSMQKRMMYVAATNINHFWPLAGWEWRKQYKQAIALAAAAKKAYEAGERGPGDEIAARAWQYLGVAVHFLQDTFASGHQYPDALNDFDSTSMAGVALGGFEAKTYHDALCALPQGIAMLYGGGRRFHGDTTATGSDFPVVLESRNAIVHFLETMTGIQTQTPYAEANAGPDTPNILKDPEAGPIWRSMLKKTQGKRATAESKATSSSTNNLRQTNFTTPTGTKYSATDLKYEWQKLNKGGEEEQREESVVDMLVDAAMENQNNPVFMATRGTSMTATGKGGNAGKDKKIRDIVAAHGIPQLTKMQCVMVIGTLLGGYASAADCQAALAILKQQDDQVFLWTVKDIPLRLWNSLDAKSWKDFMELCGVLGARELANSIIKDDKEVDMAVKLAQYLINNGQMGSLTTAQWIAIKNRINAKLKGKWFGGGDMKAVVQAITAYLG